MGASELRLDRRTPVPAAAELPRPRNRGDRPRRIHLADAVVDWIGDVDVARPVHRHGRGETETGLGRWPPVPAAGGYSGPRNRRDRPRRIHFADAVVSGIGDVEVARPVHRHLPGGTEMRLDRRASVPAEAAYSGPRDRGDRPRRIHLADAMGVAIGDVDIARPVHRHADGAIEMRLDRRASVPDRWPPGEGGDSRVGICWNIYQLPTGCCVLWIVTSVEESFPW